MNTIALLATALFVRILAPSSIAYAPDALVIPYPETNIVWHIDETVEPPREWADTNIVTAYRTELAPTAADYLAQNWLKNAIVPPSPSEGYMVASTRYEARGEAVYAVYAYAPIPAPVRRWTPLSIKRAATALGRWDALQAFLAAANAYEDFVMAQYEAEDDAQFVALMAAARAQFGDAWVDEILNSAEVE